MTKLTWHLAFELGWLVLAMILISVFRTQFVQAYRAAQNNIGKCLGCGLAGGIAAWIAFVVLLMVVPKDRTGYLIFGAVPFLAAIFAVGAAVLVAAVVDAADVVGEKHPFIAILVFGAMAYVVKHLFPIKTNIVNSAVMIIGIGAVIWGLLAPPQENKYITMDELGGPR